MKIVSISGLDGSGKSTQIKLLQSYLESQGKKVFYFHAIQFGIAQKIKEFRQKYCPLCRITQKCNFPATEKSITKSGKLGIFLRKIFLKIDLCRFKKLYKKLTKEGFDYIVSDRYFYDSIINIEYLSNYPKVKPSVVLRFNLRIFRIFAPDLAIYLQISPENIMQRTRKPDQGIEYLQDKKVFYDAMVPVWNLKIVDGNKSPEEIFEELKKLV